MEPILKADYKNRVAPALMEKLSLANVHEIPRIEKVVINCCMGKEADRKQYGDLFNWLISYLDNQTLLGGDSHR